MGFDILPSATHRSVLQRQRKQDDAAVWLLRSLPSRLMLGLTKLAEEDQVAAMVAIVESGLVGWEGVSRDGAPVEFVAGGSRQVRGLAVDGGAAGESVDMLPVDVVSELAGELMRINTLDAGSAGNS